MVILTAIQEAGGKCVVEVQGVPDSGDLHEMAKDMPRVFKSLAVVAQVQDQWGKEQPRM